MEDHLGRRGQFVAIVAGRFHLRPIGGGREWAVQPAQCHEVEPTQQEASRLALSAQLHRQNLLSRARLG